MVAEQTIDCAFRFDCLYTCLGHIPMTTDRFTLFQTTFKF